MCGFSLQVFEAFKKPKMTKVIDPFAAADFACCFLRRPAEPSTRGDPEMGDSICQQCGLKIASLLAGLASSSLINTALSEEEKFFCSTAGGWM